MVSCIDSRYNFEDDSEIGGMGFQQRGYRGRNLNVDDVRGEFRSWERK